VHLATAPSYRVMRRPFDSDNLLHALERRFLS
jgi:hypothetical protein